MLYSCVTAQGAYEEYGDYQDYQDYNGDYGQEDTLYHDYAERKQTKE